MRLDSPGRRLWPVPASGATCGRTQPPSLAALSAAPAVAPQRIQVNPLTASQLEVTWDPPPPESQNGNIQGYKARRSRARFGSSFRVTCVPDEWPESPVPEGLAGALATWPSCHPTRSALFPALRTAHPQLQSWERAEPDLAPGLGEGGLVHGSQFVPSSPSLPGPAKTPPRPRYPPGASLSLLWRKVLRTGLRPSSALGTARRCVGLLMGEA